MRRPTAAQREVEAVDAQAAFRANRKAWWPLAGAFLVAGGATGAILLAGLLR